MNRGEVAQRFNDMRERYKVSFVTVGHRMILTGEQDDQLAAAMKAERGEPVNIPKMMVERPFDTYEERIASLGPFFTISIHVLRPGDSVVFPEGGSAANVDGKIEVMPPVFCGDCGTRFDERRLADAD